MAGRPAEYAVLHAPKLESLAQDIASQLEGTVPVLCTSGLLPTSQTGLCWDTFPSGDPNIKVRIDTVRDKHVVLVMNHDTMHLFEQMAVLLFLQRFNVPHADAEYARGAWKRTVCDGRYDEASVASLTVIVPWYRHCQMERTSRWTLNDQNKWDNGKPDGEFLDVPTAQSFAAMLSSLPIPGHRPAPPQQLLLIDIHEYDDLEITLDSSHRWANRKRPYDFDRGTGTYFASAFEHFLKHVLHGRLTDVATSYVVFPDKGAHRRFYTMVRTALGGEIALSNILWIEKSRVGADIVQAEHFLYLDEQQATRPTDARFPDGARVLIADDFTNSGGAPPVHTRTRTRTRTRARKRTHTQMQMHALTLHTTLRTRGMHTRMCTARARGELRAVQARCSAPPRSCGATARPAVSCTSPPTCRTSWRRMTAPRWPPSSASSTRPTRPSTSSTAPTPSRPSSSG